MLDTAAETVTKKAVNAFEVLMAGGVKYLKKKPQSRLKNVKLSWLWHVSASIRETGQPQLQFFLGLIVQDYGVFYNNDVRPIMFLLGLTFYPHVEHTCMTALFH